MISFLRGLLVGVGEDAIVLDVSGVGYHVFVPSTVLEQLPRVGETMKIHTYFHHREEQVQLFGFQSEEELAFFRLLLEVSGIGPKVGLAILSTFPAKQLERAIVTEDMMVLTRIPGIGKKTAQRLVVELRDKLLKQGLRVLPITYAYAGESAVPSFSEEANQSTFVITAATSSEVSPVVEIGSTEGNEAGARTTALDGTTKEAQNEGQNKALGEANQEAKRHRKNTSTLRQRRRQPREEALEALQALGYSSNEAKDALIELAATTESEASVEEWIKGALRYLARG
ncbi:Holliday junction branch migration protein RuvA [Heliorestis convoluta]|uniref:Holliday junction branch migration complex subunit RuvA n=1 Tax=Heliorestis convoluta TaxID=356322 RepID=A0A5Q2MZN9_9FIRM|nr:Holliday junction branch migration protein RuvA [Heliorestis convoluta]QGG46686.1 holliday junction DNA helicase RuvA [Heliorestis convoluta]